MRTVTIHAGLPKCGSTALQFILASNRARLLGEGVFYPENGRDGLGHMPFTGDLVEASRAGVASAMLTRAVEAFAGGGATRMVLSSEGFSVKAPKFAPCAFGDLLSPFAVEVVLFVRRRDDWTRSFYKQAVCSMSRRFAGTLDDFLVGERRAAQRLKPGFLARAMERFLALVDADGRVLFSLDREGKGTEELFGRVIGVPLESYAGDGSLLDRRKAVQFSLGHRINTSYSDAAVMFLAACNRAIEDEAVHVAIRVALAEVDTADVAPDVRMMPPELARRLLDDAREDEERLGALFGAPLPMPVPREDAGAQYRQRLTRDEFVAIRDRVVAAIADAGVRRVLSEAWPRARLLA